MQVYTDYYFLNAAIVTHYEEFHTTDNDCRREQKRTGESYNCRLIFMLPDSVPPRYIIKKKIYDIYFNAMCKLLAEFLAGKFI